MDFCKQAGVDSCKIWAYGTMTPPTANLPACKVKWDLRHVATAVRITARGGAKLMVLDPSLFEHGPVPFDEWKNLLQPFRTRCSNKLVLDFPISGAKDFDPSFRKTNQALGMARVALQYQIMNSGPPPYAECES
jgi:hypothetical protein